MDYKDQLIFVTGSCSGIGKACSELLLEKNVKVIGLDIHTSTIIHDQYHHFVVDIKDEASISSIMDQVINRYGQIYGLANCAGIYGNAKPFYEITLGEWEHVFSTNLTGMFLVSKHVVKKMMPYKMGKVVNISCIRSRIFRENMADYAATKAGVVALTSAMALDLKDYNIQVNSVAPGFTYTGMTSESFDNQEVKKYSESIIPLGKIAQPEDIAKVVLFLLSDMSDYINGETIFADGGFKISK
jgi:NAD(P)-dependent dehydrogenase (short-subunit alcohol dehydrogenase family)